MKAAVAPRKARQPERKKSGHAVVNFPLPALVLAMTVRLGNGLLRPVAREPHRPRIRRVWEGVFS